MDIIGKDATDPRASTAAVQGSEDHLELGDPHDALSSKLEQQIRLIALCFRLKGPRSGFSPSEWLVLSALANAPECGLKPLTKIHDPT